MTAIRSTPPIRAANRLSSPIPLTYALIAAWRTSTLRNVASISAVYALPVKSRNLLISGWSLNTIVTLQGGFPFTPQLSYNPSNNGDTRNPIRPFVNPFVYRTGHSRISDPMVQSGGISCRTNRERILRQFRPRPRSSDRVLLPGIFSLLKDTHLGERSNLQFRAEFFNVLNRANFNSPNAVTFTPTGVFSDGRTNYQYIHFFTPGSVRTEAALVGVERRNGNVERMTPGSSVSIKGSLISQSDFYFNGQFEGTIQADQSTVTIGPNGKLLGDVTARQVIVCGVVTGNVFRGGTCGLTKDQPIRRQGIHRPYFD